MWGIGGYGGRRENKFGFDLKTFPWGRKIFGAATRGLFGRSLNIFRGGRAVIGKGRNTFGKLEDIPWGSW